MLNRMTGTVKLLTSGRRRPLTDNDIVIGVQKHDRKVEDEFYGSAKRYFDEHFNDVFFDRDRKQEVFQMAFLKLWTEMENGTITVCESVICRRQRNGELLPMTCRLNTFLMTFAKNEYREMVRTDHLDTYSDILENIGSAELAADAVEPEEDMDAVRSRVIDECIQGMSAGCVEVLTLFYYQGKSLDEILEIRQDRNTSKNGLKTAKNKCMNTLRTKVLEEFERFI